MSPRGRQVEQVGVSVQIIFSFLGYDWHAMFLKTRRREWQRVRCGGTAMWFSGHATVAGRRGNNLSAVAGAFPSSVCGFTHASRSCACLHSTRGRRRRDTCQDVKPKERSGRKHGAVVKKVIVDLGVFSFYFCSFLNKSGHDETRPATPAPGNTRVQLENNHAQKT